MWKHPAAAGRTFLLDDDEPVSTPELIRAVGRPAHLMAVLEAAGTLLGKRAAVARLTGSLFVDSSPIRSRLGWAPPFTLKQGLAVKVETLRGTSDRIPPAAVVD